MHLHSFYANARPWNPRTLHQCIHNPYLSIWFWWKKHICMYLKKIGWARINKSLSVFPAVDLQTLHSFTWLFNTEFIDIFCCWFSIFHSCFFTVTMKRAPTILWSLFINLSNRKNMNQPKTNLILIGRLFLYLNQLWPVSISVKFSDFSLTITVFMAFLPFSFNIFLKLFLSSNPC